MSPRASSPPLPPLPSELRPRRKRGLVVPVALALIVVGGSAPAEATTLDDITLEELARASDLIVVGRVESVDVHTSGPAGQPGIHSRAVIQVSDTLRGAHRTIVEVWVHGGRLGNRMRVVPGQATLRPGEDVALFLFEAGGGLWPTGMSRGRWPLVPTTDGAIAPPGTVSPGAVVSMSELAQRIGSVP